MITVVHVKNKYTVYGGRSGKGVVGHYGNPFIVGIDGERGECIKLFEQWFHSDDHKAKLMRERALDELKENDILGCFCKPNPCHCDIIAAYVNTTKGYK